MFFIVYLPLAVFGIAFGYYIISAINDKDWTIALGGFFKSSGWGLLTSLFFLVFGFLMFWGDAPASVYSDTNHPQYLVSIPGYDTPKYLISTESLEGGENYTFALNASQEMQTFSASLVRIVTDDPTRPFIAEIKHTCDGKKLWVPFCLNPSPYRYEIHIPTGSIIYLNP